MRKEKTIVGNKRKKAQQKLHEEAIHQIPNRAKSLHKHGHNKARERNSNIDT